MKTRTLSPLVQVPVQVGSNFGKVKKWVCYGKRSGEQPIGISVSTEVNEITKLPKVGQLDVHWAGMTKIIYDQQNMIECFEEKNFYRLLFAFFYSMISPTMKSLAGNSSQPTEPVQDLRSGPGKGGVSAVKPTRPKVPLVSLAPWKLKGEKFDQAVFAKGCSISWLPTYGSSKKLILFGRSEVKRLFRKALFIKPESILFSQIFLIPLAGFFGILYTFWTFSVSSTVTFKEYIPLVRTCANFSDGTKRSWLGSPAGQLVANEVGTNKTEGGPISLPAATLLQTAGEATSLQTAGEATWLPLIGYDPEIGRLEDLPFFTSYKVDWSPTRGLSDFLRLTNAASKIFILWASLAVFRSLRPTKANRPEMRIQTRFLRPFQNRKRFHDLEGIEKFSSVLTTLTESIQGSFKDPLFYLVLAFPNLPFFQPFQKAIGKFRFFLFYGKQTEFLRKPLSFFIGMVFPKEKQKRNQTYPKGYLFIGPPGTGKTLLAQAIAGESKVNFICLSASEIQKQIDIGTRIGALRLRNLFEEARTLTPCILFFDEIDTLGRARYGFDVLPTESTFSGSSIRKQTFFGSRDQKKLNNQPTGFNQRSWSKGSQQKPPQVGGGNQDPSHGSWHGSNLGSDRRSKLATLDLKIFTEFLVQMDSFSVKDGFLVIGTTNFLSSLDPAFVRSGRFDRILGLTYPPKQTRIAILKLHIQKKGNLFDTKIPWNIFGIKTKDLSPADLSKVVNESSLYLLNHLEQQKPAELSGVRSTGPKVPQTSASVYPNIKEDAFISPSSHFQPLASGFHWVQNLAKDLFLFQPGLIHTSRSLREGLVKILESKKE